MGAVPGASSPLEGSWQFEKLWRVKLDRLQSGQAGRTNGHYKQGLEPFGFIVPAFSGFPDFRIIGPNFCRFPPLLLWAGALSSKQKSKAPTS
jgi:hypothetical protein